MARLFCVCITAALLMGCATRYQRARTIAIIGGTLTLVSATAILTTAKSDPEEAVAITLWFGVPSLVMLVTGLPYVIAHRNDDERAEQQRAEAARAEQARQQHEALVGTRERAWALTKEAATAARAGNCIQVRVFDREVRASDAEFHATVFLRDLAIHRCLAAR